MGRQRDRETETETETERERQRQREREFVSHSRKTLRVDQGQVPGIPMTYEKMNTPNPVVYGAEAASAEVVMAEDPPQSDASLCCPTFLSCCLSCVCPWVWLGACRTLNEKEAALVMTWGKFTSVIKKPGLFCFNPCGIEFQVVSVKQKTTDLPGVKLLDLKGNPVVVSGVVFWQISGVKAASLNVENVYQYVHTVSQTNTHTLSLSFFLYRAFSVVLCKELLMVYSNTNTSCL